MSEYLQQKIALTLIPNIGDILAKRLVAYCGSPEAVFSENKKALEKIPGIGERFSKSILDVNAGIFKRAEAEVTFIENNNITPLFYLDKNYPKRLNQCEDSPVMLYYKGNADLNTQRIVSIVGTRNATNYGKNICEKLVDDLKGLNVTIVSGLAYGIDICSHKAAIKNNIPTVAVLAHGLDRIYPSTHQNTAQKMLENGGWLSDYMSETNPDRENFPSRNRIVAGMADATIVVESKSKGGSLITADIANSYNRDVFAFPGKVGDVASEGCNNIIKQNKAALIQSAKDLMYIMGWEQEVKKAVKVQHELFHDLTPEEQNIVSVLKQQEKVAIDDLCLQSKLPSSKVAQTLLNLEFSGIVKTLPGKVYQLT